MRISDWSSDVCSSDLHPKRHYPVLYALPGTSNTADVWLDNIDTVEMTESLPLIVVIPDGTFDADGGGFYTNWVDQTTSRGVEIGRASCRERVCQYVSISVVAVSLKKTQKTTNDNNNNNTT